MRILIKSGDGLHRDPDYYQEFIKSNVGKILNVNVNRLRRGVFFLSPKLLDPDGDEASINKLDVQEVFEDLRLGRSMCKSCFGVAVTGSLCKCPTPSMQEFSPGSKIHYGAGLDQLVDEAFEEMLPNS